MENVFLYHHKQLDDIKYINYNLHFNPSKCLRLCIDFL